MPLDNNEREYVNNVFAKKQSELTRQHDAKLREIQNRPRGGARDHAIGSEHLGYWQALINAKVEAYIEAFNLHNKTISQSDIETIVKEISDTLSQWKASTDLRLPSLNQEGQTALMSIAGSARRDLSLERQRQTARNQTADNRQQSAMKATLGDVLVTEDARRNVFVIVGRNARLTESMFSFLRALDLHPLEWSHLIAMTRKGSPTVPEILENGFRRVGAVVAMLTPDDRAFLHPSLCAENDKEFEKQPTGQARPNVLFEMGMAFALHADRTILVQLGELRPYSDIAGRHVLHFDGSQKARHELKTRLRTAGCPVNDAGTSWLSVGDFQISPTVEFKLNVHTGSLDVSQPDSTSLVENQRRANLLHRLRQKYIFSNDNLSAGMLAGLDPLPKEWVDRELAALGETWRRDRYV